MNSAPAVPLCAVIYRSGSGNEWRGVCGGGVVTSDYLTVVICELHRRGYVTRVVR